MALTWRTEGETQREREGPEQSHCRRRRVRRPHTRATAVEAGSCSSSPVCPASAPAPERRAPPAACRPARPHLVLLLHAVVRAAATRPAHARAPPRLAVLPATAPLGPRPLLPLDQLPAPLGPCVLPALLLLTAATLATVAAR